MSTAKLASVTSDRPVQIAKGTLIKEELVWGALRGIYEVAARRIEGTHGAELQRQMIRETNEIALAIADATLPLE